MNIGFSGDFKVTSKGHNQDFRKRAKAKPCLTIPRAQKKIGTDGKRRLQNWQKDDWQKDGPERSKSVTH